jgi:importin subunit alpha-6/7
MPAMMAIDLSGTKGVLEPPIRIVGNLLTGNDVLTERMISLGCIDFLGRHLNSPYKTIRRESTWGLSNIAAGTLSQVVVLAQSPVFPKVCELVKDPDVDVAREATWTISNCISGSDIDNCIKLLNCGVMDALLYVLANQSEPTFLQIALEGLKQLFIHGETIKNLTNQNPIITAFNGKGGIDHLERLQEHKDESVYKAITDILEKFYNVTEVKEKGA